MTENQEKIDVLVGWDQIADFLQVHKNTARRYHKNGMPVSRPGGKIPRAFPDELFRWQRNQK